MKPRVLVIEDNAANVELMRYILTAAGCDVIIALDGLAGLSLIERETFDLVLCDISMPKLNGYQLAARVRENPALAHVTLIAVTAFAMEEDGRRIMEAGFDAYFTKPIAPRTFAGDVLRHLKAPRMPAGDDINGQHTDRR